MEPTTGFSTAGCIDAKGKVIEDGFAIASGAVWIEKSELAKAEAWGWRATGLASGRLVVVSRLSKGGPASGLRRWLAGGPFSKD